MTKIFLILCMTKIFFHNINTIYCNAMISLSKISQKRIALHVEHSAYRITVGSIESLDNRYSTLVYLRHICGSANMALCHRRVIFGSAAAWPREPVRKSRCAIVLLSPGSL